jgi:superfamily I DNA and/or RNA helicase
MADLALMRKHSRFKNKSTLIASFYKAQVTKLKFYRYNLPDVTIIDSNGLLSTLSCNTVKQVQGSEFDVVLLSLVHTTNPAFVNEPHRLLVARARRQMKSLAYSLRPKMANGIWQSWRMVA